MPADPIAEIRSLITRHWGFHALRPLQEQAIRADLDRRDSLVVMPTGGGKSLCYQAPAAYRTNETTVVVSPLISLMKDQVDSLTSADVKAFRVDSTLTDSDKIAVGREMKAGRVRLLFASPERMVTERFQNFLREHGVRTFAIDEAHCISHWGHDFRPEYRQLASIRDKFPEATFHAFTATATEQVRQDIIDQLHLRNPAVLVGNFDRPNLIYRVLQRRTILDQILEVLERRRGQAGIIYCPSRKEVDQLAEQLRELGFNAMCYRAAHPDESADDNQRMRKATHDAFRTGACDLVVATVAFGMGIDRSDIRFVLHTGMPQSIEHYQQEAGRAGRDGLEAECLMYHSGRDVIKWKDMARKSFEQGRIDRELLAHSGQQAEQINTYAKGGKCRHRVLVEHFGQKFEPEACGACDVCLGEVAWEPDSTVVAQKIISCVARVGERFGAGHVTHVLRGSNNERVGTLGHDKLSTFGLLSDQPERQVRDWITQLIGTGLLEQTTDEYPVLRLNDDSWQVLRGRREVKLTRAGTATASKKSRAEEVSWEGVDAQLFEELRIWRRELAAKKGMPPYTIFHDGTLRDISRVRPTTLEGLHQISGVGEARLREHGQAVLDLVAKIAGDAGLTTDNKLVVDARASRAKPPSNAAAEGAFPYYRERKSIAEVALLMERMESTARDYLCCYIYQERPDSIDAWIDRATQDRISAAAKEHGSQKLKPIFLALNQEVSYDAIRVVLTHINARSDG
ncbi:MAG TPA: DNA helicase RecQ [Gemmataceae bacterium]|jgi:ATP-dependent DNA helicase RecQ|nr:DNA helicase RecQ [Gemmataceae bacterium]